MAAVGHRRVDLRPVALCPAETTFLPRAGSQMLGIITYFI